MSARHSVASDRPPSTQAALEPSHAEPGMHQAPSSAQPSSQEKQQPGPVEVVYAADASAGNGPRDGGMMQVDRNAGSEGTLAAREPHLLSVGAAQGLEAAMPKDGGDAAASEPYTPPYTPPGEATPPYTPPGGPADPRDDEGPRPFGIDARGEEHHQPPGEATPPYMPPGQEPEETGPVAGTDPSSSSHGGYSHATIDRDDTEQQAPGSPRGFLGEVFTLDRIGATTSSKSIKAGGGQDDKASDRQGQSAAAAAPDASAARGIDDLMANLEFSTAGPPSQKNSGLGGKAAPAKKTAKQSSLAQQV